MNLPALAVRRPIAVSAIALAAGVFGITALARLPVDMMPEIEAPVISVVTRYPGANARDVEENVTKILEESVGDVSDLEKISSASKENVSVLALTFAYGTDLDEAGNRVREHIELAKRRFPADVESPMLFHFSTTRFPVLMMGFVSSGGDPFANSKIIEDRILEPLRRIPGVGAVQVWNAPDRQILVEVNRPRLTAFGLTLDGIARTLAAESIELPAGHLQVGQREFTVRAPAEYDSLGEIANIIVARSRDGGLVRLRDLATVRPALEELDEQAAVGSNPAMWCLIMKRAGANTVEVARRVHEELAEIEPALPPTLRLIVLTDASRFIMRTLDNLKSTAFLGGLLLLLVVWLFLRWLRASLIVVLAIPLSILTVFVVLYLCGYTLNTMSLLAVAIAVGMVVDNAIVVLDNISRHADQGAEAHEAAGRGAAEVAGAISASTLTTLIIFVPLVLVTGLVGVLFTQLAVVLAATLTASLLVALTVVPAYWARLFGARATGGTGDGGLGAGRRWFRPVQAAYGRLLAWALGRRALIVIGAVVLTAATVALLPLLGFDFMPRQDSGEIHFRADLPKGTSVEHSMRIGQTLAAIAERQPEVAEVAYKAGTPKLAWVTAMGGHEGRNVITGMASLVPPPERQRRDVEVAAALRQAWLRVPEVLSLTVETGDMLSRMMGGFGRPLVVEIFGDQYAPMHAAATRVRGLLAQTPGTDDIAVDRFETQPELRFVVDRERASRLGVPATVAAAALRTAFYGQVVSRYRPEGDDVDVVLRLDAQARGTISDIGEIAVPGAGGALAKLRDLGQVVEEESPVEIRRKNKQRVVTVGAGVAGRPLGDVARDVEAAIARANLPGDVTVRLAGEVAEQRATFRDLGLLLALGALLVYLVMAAQYESLIDPLVLMFSLPFSFTGAFLALLLTRTTLSVPAFLGLVMLLGIVVNNAIVLVDYVNQLRRDGLALERALLTTGAQRLRPILMTTITTVFATLPLALGYGEGAEFWAPLARVVAGGLIFSTLVTLILIPVVYASFEPLRRGSPAYAASFAPSLAPRGAPAPAAAAAGRPSAIDGGSVPRADGLGAENGTHPQPGCPRAPETMDAYLRVLGAMLAPLGNSFRYRLTPLGSDRFSLSLAQCSPSASNAPGCALLPLLQGQLDGLGIAYQMTPRGDACPLAPGASCVYTVTLRFPVSGERDGQALVH